MARSVPLTRVSFNKRQKLEDAVAEFFTSKYRQCLWAMFVQCILRHHDALVDGLFLLAVAATDYTMND